MIFLHTILALIAGKFFGHYAAFLIGSVMVDIDHLYVYLARTPALRKDFSWKRLVDLVKNERTYKISARTPLVHSLFGAVLFTFLVYSFAPGEALYFGVAYLSHIILDLFDKDPTYLLFPWKKPFHGPMPVWSTAEKTITVLSIVGLVLANVFW